MYTHMYIIYVHPNIYHTKHTKCIQRLIHNTIIHHTHTRTYTYTHKNLVVIFIHIIISIDNAIFKHFLQCIIFTPLSMY